MGLTLLTAVGVLLCTWVGWNIQSYLSNRRKAIATGLPYVSTFCSEFNPLWFLISDSKWMRAIISKNQFLNELTMYHRPTWRWYQKEKPFEKYGPALLVVSPSRLIMELTDHTVIEEVYSSRDVFQKSKFVYEIIHLYGYNVVFSEGSIWNHHRRHIVPAFNENNNLLVFQQSIRQAQGLLQKWDNSSTEQAGDTTILLDDPGADYREIAFNVISAAGYGMDMPAIGDTSSPEDNLGVEVTVNEASEPFNPDIPQSFARLSYKTALRVVSDNFVTIAVIQHLWPERLHRHLSASLFGAYDDLSNYLGSLMEYERSRIAANSNPTSHGQKSLKEHNGNSILGTLVKGSEKSTEDIKGGLSEDEIKSNLWVLALAGTETTAATLEHSLLLLAMHPEQQDWLYGEIKKIFKDEAEMLDLSSWDYQTLFPKLAAPLAVMSETHRLYPPVATNLKENINRVANLNIGGTQVSLPPNTILSVSFPALGRSKRYYGQDASSFRPKRWLKTYPENSSSWLAQNDKGPVAGYPEEIYTPPKGVNMSFSEGVRACLGKKFAQIEYCIILMAVVSRFRLELKPETPGQTVEETRKAMLDAFDQMDIQPAFRLAGKAGLKLEKRR